MTGLLFFLLNFILQTFNSFRNTIFINHNHNYTNIIFINKSSGHKYIMPLTNINYLLKHATLSIVPIIDLIPFFIIIPFAFFQIAHSSFGCLATSKIIHE